jgi:ABC-2 type transport system permease protein
MRRMSPFPVQRPFGFATHARQTLAIAGTAFRTIATSPAGLVLLGGTLLVGLLMPAVVDLQGLPVLPRTAHVLTVLTAPVADTPSLPWVLIPLLIVFYAGELVWRERDAGLSELFDATPVREWVLFLGKFLGLVLVLVAWLALLTAAGVTGQMRMGYLDFEVGLYLRVFFGLQLIDYVLFALLTFVVHAVVNQRHLGYLVSLLGYGMISFPSVLGLEHHLLIYGSGPRWSYSDIRGFDPSLAPWLWFKLYWAAWAVLLAVVARVLWPRGSERSLWSRLQLARRRATPATIAVATTAAALVVTLGGFIFYNTNVLHPYITVLDRARRGAEYERRFKQYAGIPQPRLTATTLRVEIYPEQRMTDVSGTYRLVNDDPAAVITAIHVATATQVDTRAVSFDRPIAGVVEDAEFGHGIYILKRPLHPGEAVQLTFEVHVELSGFRNDGADGSIVANGTHFTNLDWLPAIGYQSNRELDAPGARRRYGLAPRPAVPALDDPVARRVRVGGDPITFDAIVGTSWDQVAVAPGALRRTWTEGGRRYAHYVADVPINNEYGIFSAAYEVHEDTWVPSDGVGRTVAIQIFHHPGHTETLHRMVAGVRASLDHYTRHFGPYPYSYLRLIESPTLGSGVRTDAATVEYGEGFALLNPGDGPDDLDIVFAVVAHGVARNWFGIQVAPAAVAGAGLLDRSLETYAAMRVVEDALGAEHLTRYLSAMRAEFGAPHTRAAPPLLRATDSFAFARRGPFALYALSRYIGVEPVNEALRHLVERHGSRTSPPTTSFDLYQELQAVAPEKFQPLLEDLFAKNTFWEFETTGATAMQTSAGEWQVTLDVSARKVVVDEAGVETQAPMDDWIEIGVYGEGELYLQTHRIRSGSQAITVTVPRTPTRAGIDPRHLVSDLEEIDANSKPVKIGN